MQRIVTDGAAQPNPDVKSTDYSTIWYGTQNIYGTMFDKKPDHSCGFWQIMFALVIIFKISRKSLPQGSLEAKHVVRRLYDEYSNGTSNGTTQATVIDCLAQYAGDLSNRFPFAIASTVVR